jgi:uncharacterized membrane protein
MLGALLAVVGSAWFGFNNASVRRGVLTGSVLQALAITVPIGVPLFFIGAVISGQLFNFSDLSVLKSLSLAAGGVAHFVLGRYCNYRASKAMGANRAAPILQVNLLLTLALAIIILDDFLTPLKLLGIGLILAGPTVMIRRGKKKESQPRPAPSGGSGSEGAGPALPKEKLVFVPNLREGYTFAILSSFGYTLSPIFVRYGLRDTDLSLLGGLISYAAAAVVIGLVLLLPGKWAHVRSMDRTVSPWFLRAGVAVFFSQMFRYMALSMAPVTVVAPLMRLSLVFRVVFAWILNREYETFETKVLLGIGVSMIGALALGISLDLVVDNVPLPDFLVRASEWRWP